MDIQSSLPLSYTAGVSGTAAMPGTADGGTVAGPDGAAPPQTPDAFLLQKEQAEEQQAQQLSEKLESLKSEIASRTKKADKINRIVGGPGLYIFCGTSLGVIVGGALGPLIAPIMLGVLGAEGIAALIARHKEKKIEKSIAPLAEEAYATQQQMEKVEKQASDIKELGNMCKAADGNEDVIDDDDNFIFIDGVKLRKQSHQTIGHLNVIFRNRE